ncbi:MAG: helix-turn-helix transcriptional regulator [Chelatococcus sp.]|jgi:DNA-binding CsgD family transcriptional regulator|uniref:helix-turn-helix transcriptional regulator n=1 Tax=unclassified Chelatococcus TaxID=2638111 RepID=UPI001BD02476|nr:MULTISPECIES: helix-turn-helix transcriptional regulator [unclassified Chelatococcus]CAH1654358.1 putative Regulatory protein, luxR family [Hyphomicrobiales bacterium]MBS7742793.1 helix-turn-helix transcriptional regulator [Chelatococcus sp. HY11]MBX3538445.1 helix-turn-helix transcriptional regulator [Chelatococcus sp.]MBX3542089.1 helix-turn-helix transcriptional regulator [Chelatococcus sp.]MCO5075695.1 helix-turn-helix transcriptional regulator [Chelatococcus sp.]
MLDALVLAMGTSRFNAALFAMMNECVQARQVVVYRYGGGSPVECIIDVHKEDDRAVTGIVRKYINGYYLRDPMRAMLCPSDSRRTQMSFFNVNHIEDIEYRRLLYLLPRMSGKMAVILQKPDETLAISVYRGIEHGDFGAREYDALAPHMSTLAAIVERHVELVRSRSSVASVSEIKRIFMQTPLEKPLSEREGEVCARVVAGYSNEAISLDLSVSMHSVVTYRRRAYQKLNVTSQSELFSMVLSGERAIARRSAVA